MLQVGSQVDVRGLDGEVVTCTIRALRAKGGQGYVYTLRGPEDDTYVLKVPGPQGLVGNEVERRILQTIPPHPISSASWGRPISRG